MEVIILETLYVLKITNEENIPLEYWYKNKHDNLFICRYDEVFNIYITFNKFDNGLNGFIKKEHAEILTVFQYNKILKTTLNPN